MDRLSKLKELSDQDSNDPFVKYAIALEYVRLNEKAAAENYFQLLLRENPDYLATYYKYGKLLEETGETDKAEQIYRSGISLADKQNDLHTKSELQDALDNLF